MIWKDCVLEKNPNTNDGDSFQIRIGGDKNQLMVVRLYGVDCMETNAKKQFMKDRLKEQGLYFGIHQKDIVKNNYAITLKLGKDATDFTKKALQKPFTVITKQANAMGQQFRIYAYILTNDGKDLGQLLVKAGLARVYGRLDDLPEVQTPYEYGDHLRITEILAIKKGVGAWFRTDWKEFEKERKEYIKLVSKLKINNMKNIPVNVALIVLRAEVTAKIAQAVLTEAQIKPFKNEKDIADRVAGVGAQIAKDLGKVLVFK